MWRALCCWLRPLRASLPQPERNWTMPASGVWFVVALAAGLALGAGCSAVVAHEGDIVDADEPAQWERAATTLHALDGVVPLLLSAGNHDYRRDGRHIDRRTSINQYFAPATAGGTVEAVSTFEPGHLENSSLLLSAPGGPWLLLSLEFGPRDAVLAWADSVLDRHARVPAILVTHAYLDADGARYDHVGHPGQLWNPHRY